MENIMEVGGVLTIYAFVALPHNNNKTTRPTKRLTVYKSLYCASLEEANDTLETLKELNPHLALHAELVVTRYIG